jgi:hypothetical protein
MRLLRWGWVALGICDLFQHRDCALHCSLCMVSYAGLRVSSVCCARTQGIVSGARCGDARGGRGNGERAYVTVCTPAPGACVRHRQRVLRARTAVGRTPDMDANDSPARTAPFETHRYDARCAHRNSYITQTQIQPCPGRPPHPTPSAPPRATVPVRAFGARAGPQRGTGLCVCRAITPRVNS